MSKNSQKNKERFREIWRRKVSNLADDELLNMAKDRNLELVQRKIVNDVLKDRGLFASDVNSMPAQQAKSDADSVRVTWRGASIVWVRGMLTAVLAGVFVVGAITWFLSSLFGFEGSGTPAESLGELIELFAGLLISIAFMAALVMGSGYCNSRDSSFSRTVLSGPHAVLFHMTYFLVAATSVTFAYTYLTEDIDIGSGYLFVEIGGAVSRTESDEDWVYVALNEDALRRLLSDEFEPTSLRVGVFGEQFVAEIDKHDIQGKSLLWGGQVRDFADSEVALILDSRGSFGMAIRVGDRGFAIQGPQPNGHYRAIKTERSKFGLDFEVVGEDVVLKK